MKPTSLAVGETWVIKSDGRVTITRPDGSTSVVASSFGLALYVLTAPGEYAAAAEDGTPLEGVTAK